jgi:hypothetical protein
MTTSLLNDLRTRMVPSAGDVARAAAAIAEHGTKMAITPIMFPGKEYGIWDDDTVVETSTLAYACNNDDSYHVARNEASIAGAKIMGERPGTVGYVVHRMYEGEVASSVFEEILSTVSLVGLGAALDRDGWDAR